MVRGYDRTDDCNHCGNHCIMLPMTEDRQLVAEVLAHRRGAFERLVKRHQGLVWTVAYRLVQHPEDARDLCQETFLLVYRKLSQYRGDSPLSGWIARIAYHLAARHQQRKRLPMAVMPSDPDEAMDDPLLKVMDAADVESTHIEQELQVLLGQAIERLPPMQGLLLSLYHLEEKSISEISSITGQPEGTIKNSLFRARQRLRGLLEPAMGVVA